VFFFFFLGKFFTYTKYYTGVEQKTEFLSLSVLADLLGDLVLLESSFG